MRGIKRTLEDVKFSVLVREKGSWRCARCGRKYNKWDSVSRQKLQASHYFGRARYSTRFDFENVDPLCGACHRIWGSDDREAYRKYMIKKLGRQRFNALVVRSNQTGKKDLKMTRMILKELYKEYNLDWKTDRPLMKNSVK